MTSYASPLQELVEAPSREKLLLLLGDWLLPKVVALQQTAEFNAQRPLGFDLVQELRDRLVWGRKARLLELSSVVHMYCYEVMMLDDEFRVLMLGDGPSERDWWQLVQAQIKAWKSAQRVDWPAIPTHPTEARYEPRRVPVTVQMAMLHDLFRLWCT